MAATEFLHILHRIQTPYVYPCSKLGIEKSEGCVHPGISAEATAAVLRMANISYTHSVFAALPSAVGEANEDERYAQAVLTTPGTCSVGWFNERIFDGPLTPYLFCDPLAGIYSNIEDTSIFSFLTVFNWSVYVSMILLYLLIRTIAVCLRISPALIRTIASVREGFDRTAHSRIILWVAFLALFASVYQSSLLSHILIKQHRNPFPNLRAVANQIKSGRAKLVLVRNGEIEQLLGQADDLRFIREAVRNNPIRLVSDSAEGLKVVVTEPNHLFLYFKFLVLEVSSMSRFQVHHVLYDDLAKQCWSIGCYANTSAKIMKRLNLAIDNARPHLQSLDDRYFSWFETMERRKNVVNKIQVRSIRMVDVRGFFATVGVGTSLAFTCLGLEAVLFLFKKRKASAQESTG